MSQVAFCHKCGGQLTGVDEGINTMAFEPCEHCLRGVEAEGRNAGYLVGIKHEQMATARKVKEAIEEHTTAEERALRLALDALCKAFAEEFRWAR